MYESLSIGVVIPAQNEERAIGLVIESIPDWVDTIVVADNGSIDATAEISRAAGAVVVHEDRFGYGAACLAGMYALPRVDVVVFVDGDFSDYPEDMADLVAPIANDGYDFVVGSRALGAAEPGSLTIPQRFGNWLATRLMALIWRADFTDLGPFRAITSRALESLEMKDRDFGWTVEMQIKAAREGLKCREVPVRYRRRIGVSKVSGTVKGTIMAGTKILAVIARHAFSGRRGRGQGARP